jgi:hypothetical protein
MATWVVYHDDSSPEVLEYVINDIPEGIEKRDIQRALSVTKDCYEGNPRQEVAFSLHGICLLDEAPVTTQTAHGAARQGRPFTGLSYGSRAGPNEQEPLKA